MKVKNLFLNPISLAGLLLILVFSTASAATNLCVRPGGGGNCFATIQAAIDVANPGDRVTISRGIYVENLEIDVEGLMLRGSGRTNTIIDAEADDSLPGIFITAADVKIEKLMVRNGNNNGIETSSDATGVLIDNVAVAGSGNDDDGNDCIDLNGAEGHVKNSLITGCDTEGIDVNDDAEDTIIERNRVTQVGSDCIISSADNVTIYRNYVAICGDQGIDIDDADNPTINNNTVASTKDQSIEVDCGDDEAQQVECTGGEIRQNTLRTAEQECIDVNANVVDGTFTVERNVCTVASDHGVRIVGNGITVTRNLVRDGGINGNNSAGYRVEGTNHVLSHNRAEDWYGQGFYIAGSDHELSRNESRRSLSDGFRISGDNVVLNNNVSQASLGVGFEITEDAENAELVRNNGFDSRVDFCDDGVGTIEDSNRFETTGACVIDNN